MTNLDYKEIDHFARDSAYWWDEDGPFKPLHKLNPVRIEYILSQLLSHFSICHPEGAERPEGSDRSFAGAQDDSVIKDLGILDIGCGGGLVCEPFARLGTSVTGVDADEQAINVAKDHASAQGLQIDYRAVQAEELEQTFDVVLALEVIEHVPDPAAFVQTCMDLCRPGGMVIFSTLNRTMKSYGLGIIAAEHILRWVPKGTHEWAKFVRPSELSRYVRQAGGETSALNGLVYNPLNDKFSIHARDVDVNYFLTAKKPA